MLNTEPPLARSSAHSLTNRCLRALWRVVWLLLFRPSPQVFYGWRRALLRLFGARIGRGAVVHPSVKIWAPWRLVMEDYACLGPYVDCYNCATISLGRYSVVSQYAFLCSATHDYSYVSLPLLAAPITLGEHAWVCADVFVGPGVTVGQGAVAGAKSSVFKDVEPWTVVAGNPAQFLKRRDVKDLP